MRLTSEQFRKDALKNKEKYIGQIVITRERDKGYLVGAIMDVRKNGLKILPIARFKTFRSAKEFVSMLFQLLKDEEPPSYIA